MRSRILLTLVALLGLAQIANANQVCTYSIPMEVLNQAEIDPVYCSNKVCSELEAVGVSAVPSVISSLALLPLSGGDNANLLTISWVSADTNEALEAGRSYNGAEWENSPGALSDTLRFRCSCDDEPTCGVDVSTITIGDGEGEWRLEAVDTSNAAQPLSAESAARFLMQTTFGPTRDTVAGLEADFAAKKKGNKGDLEDETAVLKTWIEDQIALPKTLHNAYWRERTNPPIPFGASLPSGVSTEPCNTGARYHTWAFSAFDMGLTISVTVSDPGVFALAIDGITRTEINATFVEFDAGDYIVDHVWPRLNDRVTIKNDTGSWDISNSPMQFFTSVPADFKVITDSLNVVNVTGDEGAIVLTSDMPSCPWSEVQDYAFILYEGTLRRFERRLITLDNTLDDPASVTASTISATGSCPTVERTFLNEGTCVLRETCAPLEFDSVNFVLDDANLRQFWTTSGKAVYVLRGLRLENPHDYVPCDEAVSRWMITDGACAQQTDAFGDLLVNVSQVLGDTVGVSAFVKDVNLRDVDFDCSTDTATMGVNVTVGDKCYTHVHPDEFDVVDAAYWAIAHPGNDLSAGYRPLLDIAIASDVVLNYPVDHPMQRYHNYRSRFTVLGLYGQTVDFKELPSESQAPGMAQFLGSTGNSSAATEACGAPGEVANVPSKGHQYAWYLSGELQLDSSFAHHYWTPSGKSMVMNNIVVKADDQLRQRMAWALSQILVIGEDGIMRPSYNGFWAAYFDIFVRHAFGNYRDILKEVSYSPPMSIYLTYRNNQAFSQSGTVPDENYARELMQLFTIGLYELNQDGSYVRDNDGEPIATYDNDDIMSMARAWTGFETQAFRANLEAGNGRSSENLIDPLKIRAGWRDVFPKSSLTGGYIGDFYPLCSMLGEHAFLRQGARYVKIGDSPIPKLGSPETDYYDGDHFAQWGHSRRVDLNVTTSSLHSELCADSGSGCTFPDEVLLSATLPCDGEECDVEELRSVKVVDGDNFVWYEYVKRACVQLAYYDNPKTIFSYQWGSIGNIAQCGNPAMTEATTLCCYADAEDTFWGGNHRPEERCQYLLEHVTFQKASERCARDPHATHGDREVCKAIGYWPGSESINGRAEACGPADTGMWLDQSCGLKVQLRGNGLVSIIHEPIVDTITEREFNPAAQLSADSANVVKAAWNGDYPTACLASCDSNCVCPATVQDSVPFTDSSVAPSLEQVLNQLFFASLPFEEYEDGTFVKCMTSVCAAAETKEGLTIHTHKDSNGAWDEKTRFQIPATHRYPQGLLLINKRSDVMVGEESDGFSFRNMPHFHALLETHSGRTKNTVYGAEYETEAVIDHLFLHRNTPPFVAFRLIQRFVTSNPSPRYIEAVADAFESGSYNGETISGSYGDLKAAMLAVLLDKEARTQILDVTGGHGQLREPLLKVLQLMRTLEFKSYNDWEYEFLRIHDKIGQQATLSPSVFNFYQPTYSPLGPLTSRGLFAPESQLGTAPFLIGYLNGVRDLFFRGLTGCRGGFGYGCDSVGELTFTPSDTSAETVVNELNLLLTAGRMNSQVLSEIKGAYSRVLAEDGPEDALAKAAMLVSTTAEFHSTQSRTPNRAGYARERQSGPESQGREYKAIVVVFEWGGCDSFNVLTPYDDCGDTDLYAEYQEVRTNVALPKSGTFALRPIPADSNMQPCGRMGVNPSMETVQRLYNEGDALMLANVGTLVEPVTKAEYEAKTKRVPSSLFAHNVQQTHTQTVYAGITDKPAGILGRIGEALREQAVPWKSHAYSIAGIVDMLNGKYEPEILSGWGVEQYREFDEDGDEILSLSRNESSAAFVETHNALVERTLAGTEALGAVLSATTINTAFPTHYLGRQFSQAAKIIKAREALNNTERDVFFLSQGGFDTHSNLYEDQYDRLLEIDQGLASFETEMKDQGLWDNVVVLTSSDFARTMLSNGRGTDHAWGGNYWMAGGAVNGGQIVGQFPSTLKEDGPWAVGRGGRVIPTTSWEAVWHGIAEWFGVEADQMDAVLPNMKNFPTYDMFREADLFKTTTK